MRSGTRSRSGCPGLFDPTASRALRLAKAELALRSNHEGSAAGHSPYQILTGEDVDSAAHSADRQSGLGGQLGE
jgi:hypothetical protein